MYFALKNGSQSISNRWLTAVPKLHLEIKIKTRPPTGSQFCRIPNPGAKSSQILGTVPHSQQSQRRRKLAIMQSRGSSHLLALSESATRQGLHGQLACCCFPGHCIGARSRPGCRPRRPPSASSRRHIGFVRCTVSASGSLARPQHPSRIEVIGRSPHLVDRRIRVPRPMHLRRIEVVHLCRIPSVLPHR